MTSHRDHDESDEHELAGGSLWERIRRWRGGTEGLAPASAEPDGPPTEASVEAHERTLIRNVMRLRDRTAADVMVPRVDIVAIDVETPFADLVRLLIEEGHSRLPVYQGDLDRIVGMIHVKDVLGLVANGGTTTLHKLVRPVLFAAPSTSVLDLLSQMRQERAHMACVVDEFGGIDGLVTIEDLVEEIVGDIEDEHDEVEPANITKRADGSLIADGRASIEQLDAILGTNLAPETAEEVDTVGGLVFMLSGRVPHKGEIIRHPSGIVFEVLEADERRVRALRIRHENEVTTAQDDG
jgi:CBS domain containing-hemolysin-like protein